MFPSRHPVLFWPRMSTSITDFANPQLEGLIPYEPGKPIEDVARELGLDPDSIVKLASNENPLGPSPEAVAAMKDAVEHVNLYPDGGGYRLRSAIAERFDLEIGNIVLGNGSNEIIEFAGHAFLKPCAEIVTCRTRLRGLQIDGHALWRANSGSSRSEFCPRPRRDGRCDHSEYQGSVHCQSQ